MSSRRHFIKSGLLTSGALILGGDSEAKHLAKIPDPEKSDTEDYWKIIRHNFPLDEKQIFLNNGTMGPSPWPVIEAVHQSMLEVNRKASYGGWQKAQKALARYFNAEEEEICLTRNVTEGINIIAWGLDLKAGDEIIISNQEHVGNALPWLNRARVDQLEVKVADYALNDDDLIAQIETLISKKTKVLALPHIPCTTGRVIPIERVAELAKKHNILFFADGAHGAGMLDLDLSRLPCDFYATCTHKWMLGPKGTGFLYINKDKLSSVDPKFVGGHSDSGWDILSDEPHIDGFKKTAARNNYGTQSRSQYDGVVAAIEFHEAIGKKRIANRIKELNDHLYAGLQENKQLEVLTPKNGRAGVASFRIREKEYMDFYRHCRKQKVIVRAVPECDVNCIRVSTHIYNTKEEIDHFLQILNTYTG